MLRITKIELIVVWMFSVGWFGLTGYAAVEIANSFFDVLYPIISNWK